MQRRFCDVCTHEMPKTLGEATTFELRVGAIGSVPSVPHHVTVTVPRDKDICVACRKKVVTEGQPR